MFERYDEQARRVMFFARAEVSEYGAAAIGTEHVLLGVIRESKGLVSRILTPEQRETIRSEVDARIVRRAKIDTSIEVPFDSDTSQVLQLTAEEATGLGHSYVGTEHLLLGLLRAKDSVAASILRNQGLDLALVRDRIVALLGDDVPLASADRTAVSEQIEQLKVLVERLGRKVPDQQIAGDLVSQIQYRLQRLRERLDG